MKKILEGESAGRCLEERMRESEAGGRVVVQGVVSSGSCSEGKRSFCWVTLGRERAAALGEKKRGNGTERRGEGE